jgi:hypothetical protein
VSRYLRVPQFKEPGLSRFFEEMIAAMERDAATKIDKNTANHSVLLQSPNSSVWELTITDAGTVLATKIAG